MERRRALLKRIRKLEIVTRRIVNQQMAGSYHSAFKGRGMNFDEVRVYQPGDEIRFIDWNVSARMGDVFIKQFVEERELTVFLLVDASASQLFGTGDKSKQEAAAEIGALLAFSAIKNNDRVGLIVFTDTIELFVPPKKGRKHVLRVIREILEFKPSGRRTDLRVALDFLNKVQKRKSVAFLISDFQDNDYRRSLLVASKRHDLVPIVVVDPAEEVLPQIGTVHLENPETGQLEVFDTLSKHARKRFEQRATTIREQREQLFRRLGVDFVTIRTDHSPYQPLVNYFKLRAKR
ncbi:MAG: DUF58 domain-containing protein [Myxococcota bacterium]